MKRKQKIEFLVQNIGKVFKSIYGDVRLIWIDEKKEIAWFLEFDQEPFALQLDDAVALVKGEL